MKTSLRILETFKNGRMLMRLGTVRCRIPWKKRYLPQKNEKSKKITYKGWKKNLNKNRRVLSCLSDKQKIVKELGRTGLPFGKILGGRAFLLFGNVIWFRKNVSDYDPPKGSIPWCPKISRKLTEGGGGGVILAYRWGRIWEVRHSDVENRWIIYSTKEDLMLLVSWKLTQNDDLDIDYTWAPR